MVKNLAWVAAIDEEIRALQQMTLGLWFLALPTPTLWALNECFALNICLMDPSSVSRLVLLPKVILMFLVSATLTLLVRLSKLPLSGLCFLLRSQINDHLSNLMSECFLNDILIEHVPMEQPPRYIDPRFSTHVCLLKKPSMAKQAPHAWFQRFSSFLLTVGFSYSGADTSLFVFHQQSNFIYLFLYNIFFTTHLIKVFLFS